MILFTSRIENGDAAIAIGQIVRYLDVIAPGTSLGRLLETPEKRDLRNTELRRGRWKK